MLWLKYKLLYFLTSLVVISAGVFGYFKWELNLGLDFTGGAVGEYKNDFGEVKKFEKAGINEEEAIKLREEYKKNGFKEIKFEMVGPTIAPDLVKKTVHALSLSSALILIWISIQFRSIKFGVSAILAMIHDSIVLIGSFSLLGHFFDAQVDFLFVTAILTILSFSVHDTIVVFDRIREKQKRELGSLEELSNKAITETMVRSLNNSFTIIFMLVSLMLLGGETIRWFAVALLIGTISGTYSSPFVAVPLLVIFDKIFRKKVN
jgi:preprotein translocase subunit SecF